MQHFVRVLMQELTEKAMEALKHSVAFIYETCYKQGMFYFF